MTAANPGRMLAKLLLFLGISAFFCAQTLQSAWAEMGNMDQVLLGTLVLVVFAVECGIILLARSVPVIANLLLALFTVLNIICLFAVLTAVVAPTLGTDNLVIYVILLCGAFATIYTLFVMTQDVRLCAVGFPALAWLAMVLQLLFLQGGEGNIPPGVARDLPPSMRSATFVERPNVYFISFDAMVPARISELFLQMPPTAYQQVLATRFKTFRNFFGHGGITETASTLWSLNMLLALDEDVFKRATREGRQFGFFPGLESSPLLRLFKENGYETNTHHNSGFLGSRPGPYVDHYTAVWNYALCEYQDDSTPVLSLFGYCRLFDQPWVRRVVSALGLPTREDPTDQLLKRIRAQRQSAAPQFFLAYLWSPGHASSWYKHGDPDSRAAYRTQFAERSQMAAMSLQKIIEDIDRNDPGAILFVFGDHGMYLMRTPKEADDRRAYVQDRIAVAGALYPPDRCAKWQQDAYDGAYSTVNLAAIMILNCLSDGKSAFISRPPYRVQNRDADGPGEDFKDFLYE